MLECDFLIRIDVICCWGFNLMWCDDFGTSSHAVLSFIHYPMRAVCCDLRSADADWMLIGCYNPMSGDIYLFVCLFVSSSGCGWPRQLQLRLVREAAGAAAHPGVRAGRGPA